MAHLLVFVLDDVRLCSDLLKAWEEAGARGVTILESTGLGRLRGVMRDDLPLLPSLRDLLVSQEMHHRTLFTVIEDEETLERLIATTEQIVGDLCGHHTGFLFVVPVTRVLGLTKRDKE